MLKMNMPSLVVLKCNLPYYPYNQSGRSRLENYLAWIIFTPVGLFCGKHHCCLLVQPKLLATCEFPFNGYIYSQLLSARELQVDQSGEECMGLQTFMLYTEAECTSGPCRGITTVRSSHCRG